ncbi:hypothetical protein Tco_0131100 [Tanacetum coccineum]
MGSQKEFAQETEDLLLQAGGAKASSTNIVNTACTPVSTASPYGGLSFTDRTNPNQDDSEIPTLEEIYDNPTDALRKEFSQDTEDLLLQAGAARACSTNTVNTASTPVSTVSPSGGLSFTDLRKNNHDGSKNCLFACFLSQNKPKKISEALEDESWVDVMQEELLQFKIQKVWILLDLPYEKKAIGTKWVYRNKKDERGLWLEIRQGKLLRDIGKRKG